VELGPDPLGERPVGAVLQAVAQLRLAHEHDRDEVAVVELEVREEADLLESGLAGDEVGLVHDQERGAVRFVEGEQPLVNLLEELVRVVAGLRDRELGGEGAQELTRREPRVQDHRDLVAIAELVHEGAGEERLARAHLAREQRQLHLLHRERELLERLLVHAVQEEVAGVGRLAERLLLEPEVGLVHVRPSPRPRADGGLRCAACPRTARPRRG
jgi:hypothetical protein